MRRRDETTYFDPLGDTYDMVLARNFVFIILFFWHQGWLFPTLLMLLSVRICRFLVCKSFQCSYMSEDIKLLSCWGIFMPLVLFCYCLIKRKAKLCDLCNHFTIFTRLSPEERIETKHNVTKR